MLGRAFPARSALRKRARPSSSYATGMSYNEPPEWQGRGPRSREGWPTTQRREFPPRSHRRPDDVGEQRVPIERRDTGEFRPSRVPWPDDAPTEEVPIEQTPFARGWARPEPHRGVELTVTGDRLVKAAYRWGIARDMVLIFVALLVIGVMVRAMV